ncbi:MAG TPA: PQQ-dependent sugar dehydrogenase [Methanoregulaceae archaeon]|nr:PQQ-dependent sugar dehydrogenase [Methanoregulaceae archaeon]
MDKRYLLIILAALIVTAIIVALVLVTPDQTGGSIPFVSSDDGGGASLPLDTITLPPGFSIAVYAPDVPGARSLTHGPEGVIFVGTRGEGKVYAVLDRDGDRHADRVVTVATGLSMPNGVAYRDGSLYVAEVSRILRFDDIAGRLDKPPKPVVVNDGFPGDTTHGWKFIAFGPDGMLYIPVGAPCNVCLRADPRYASIMRMNPDGSDLGVFASGVRNSVGFDWDPRTGDLWFTDNGRDWLGDDLPPDELNFAPEMGMHFGFPYCHGEGIPDPEFNKGGSCDQFTLAAQPLPAHVASLGMRFYTGDSFPGEYHNQVFIAEHGSWNRRVPTGYRVSPGPTGEQYSCVV